MVDLEETRTPRVESRREKEREIGSERRKEKERNPSKILEGEKKSKLGERT